MGACAGCCRGGAPSENPGKGDKKVVEVVKAETHNSPPKVGISGINRDPYSLSDETTRRLFALAAGKRITGKKGRERKENSNGKSNRT